MINRLARGKFFGFSGLEVLTVIAVACIAFNVGGIQGSLGSLWSTFVPASVLNTGATYTGNINYIELSQNAVTGATVAPTGGAFYYFEDKPSSMTGAITLTAAGTTRAASSKGYCWIVAEAGSSDYLLDSSKFLSQNSAYVLESGWADLANDNSVDFMAKIKTSDVGVNGQAQTPSLTLLYPFVEEDATLTLSSPADNDNTGSSEATVTIVWTITGCDAAKGFNIGRLYFTCNKTIASNEFKPEGLVISNGGSFGGRMSWSAPIAQTEGSTSYFYYIDGSPDYRHEFNGEDYGVLTGESATIYVTLTAKATLTSGDLVTLQVDQIDGDGAVTNDNDPVVINIIS